MLSLICFALKAESGWGACGAYVHAYAYVYVYVYIYIIITIITIIQILILILIINITIMNLCGACGAWRTPACRIIVSIIIINLTIMTRTIVVFPLWLCLTSFSIIAHSIRVVQIRAAHKSKVFKHGNPTN